MMTECDKDISVHIRWMIRRDMPEVLDIEARSFDFYWSEDDFIRCLRQRNCTGMVAEHKEKIIGYMLYELNKEHIDILNFAVDWDYRRNGVGTAMINKLRYKLSVERRNKLLLQIRESNLDGQLFFHKQGFNAMCVLSNCYDETNEDCYLMEYKING